MKDKNVRFIRKNGRLIPIKVKDGKKLDNDKKVKANLKKNGASSSDHITKNEYTNIFKNQARKDRRLANQGKKVRNASFAVSAISGLGAIAGKSKWLGVTSLTAGAFGMINQGFAEGRENSAMTAEEIAEGKDPVKRLGGASHRTRNKAKFLKQYIKGSSV